MAGAGETRPAAAPRLSPDRHRHRPGARGGGRAQQAAGRPAGGRAVMIRPFAELLVGHAARRAPSSDAPWAQAMRHEVDAIENDYAALHWSAGCVFATYSGRVNPMRLAPL